MLTKGKNIAEKGADFSNMTQMEALLAFRNSFTQEEIEDLVHNMEEIERSKIHLYDDLRARYECNN